MFCCCCLSGFFFVACVASVPFQAKCYVSRASEDSGHAKIGARARMEKEQVGAHPLPAPFPFLLSPQFSRDQNLRSHATHSTSLARVHLLRRLVFFSLVFFCELSLKLVDNHLVCFLSFYFVSFIFR